MWFEMKAWPIVARTVTSLVQFASTDMTSACFIATRNEMETRTSSIYIDRGKMGLLTDLQLLVF
jgi:hypothetical protein